MVLFSKSSCEDLSASIIDMNSSLLFDDDEVDSILEAQLRQQEDRTPASKDTLVKLFGRLFQKLEVEVSNIIIALESSSKSVMGESPTLLFRVPHIKFVDNCEDDEDTDEPSGIQKKLSFNGFSIELVPNPPPNAIYQIIPPQEIQSLVVAEASIDTHEILITIGNPTRSVSTLQVVCLFQTMKFEITSDKLKIISDLMSDLGESTNTSASPKQVIPAKVRASVSRPLTPEDRRIADLGKKESVAIKPEDIMKDSFLSQMMYVLQLAKLTVKETKAVMVRTATISKLQNLQVGRRMDGWTLHTTLHQKSWNGVTRYSTFL